MLDIKFIRENPDVVKHASQVKNFPDVVDDILKLDVRVRELKTITQTKTAEKNKISKEIPTSSDKATLIAKSKAISEEIANDLAETVSNVLTDKQGPFKIKSVSFEEKGMESMANYIFNDKVMQGRAKNKLEDKIYSLFSKRIGKDANKNVEISFDESTSEFSYK